MEDLKFWARVQKTDTCWYWTGPTNDSSDRYGRLERGGIRWYTHRYSWFIHNGDIPKGLVVAHKCDKPKCVNPEHLFLATQKDNLLDMFSKGRDRNQNTDKTHCPRGHEYNEVNTRISNRKRYCRACSTLKDRNFLRDNS